MESIDKEINTIIMQEIGLEVGPEQKIYDQDTGCNIKLNGMDVTAPGYRGNSRAIEFDPHNNRKMMGQLFGYFLNKHSDETNEEIIAYYNIDSDNGGNRIECVTSDNKTIRSKPYIRDSLKYTDIIMQLNGEDNTTDLNKFDNPQTKSSIKNKKR